MQACRILPNQKVILNQWTSHVTPRSLYLTQLKERLGDDAVKNIIKENQTIE